MLDQKWITWTQMVYYEIFILVRLHTLLILLRLIISSIQI